MIEPVEEPTEWRSGLVLVPKSNGMIRICVDYVRFNKYVLREIHPMPNTENVLGQLGEAKYFSKMDANHGFWQYEIDQKSQYLRHLLHPLDVTNIKDYRLVLTQLRNSFRRGCNKFFKDWMVF